MTDIERGLDLCMGQAPNRHDAPADSLQSAAVDRYDDEAVNEDNLRQVLRSTRAVSAATRLALMVARGEAQGNISSSPTPGAVRITSHIPPTAIGPPVVSDAAIEAMLERVEKLTISDKITSAAAASTNTMAAVGPRGALRERLRRKLAMRLAHTAMSASQADPEAQFSANVLTSATSTDDKETDGKGSRAKQIAQESFAHHSLPLCDISPYAPYVVVVGRMPDPHRLHARTRLAFAAGGISLALRDYIIPTLVCDEAVFDGSVVTILTTSYAQLVHIVHLAVCLLHARCDALEGCPVRPSRERTMDQPTARATRFLDFSLGGETTIGIFSRRADELPDAPRRPVHRQRVLHVGLVEPRLQAGKAIGRAFLMLGAHCAPIDTPAPRLSQQCAHDGSTGDGLAGDQDAANILIHQGACLPADVRPEHATCDRWWLSPAPLFVAQLGLPAPRHVGGPGELARRVELGNHRLALVPQLAAALAIRRRQPDLLLDIIAVSLVRDDPASDGIIVELRVPEQDDIALVVSSMLDRFAIVEATERVLAERLRQDGKRDDTVGAGVSCGQEHTAKETHSLALASRRRASRRMRARQKARANMEDQSPCAAVAKSVKSDGAPLDENMEQTAHNARTDNNDAENDDDSDSDGHSKNEWSHSDVALVRDLAAKWNVEVEPATGVPLVQTALASVCDPYDPSLFDPATDPAALCSRVVRHKGYGESCTDSDMPPVYVPNPTPITDPATKVEMLPPRVERAFSFVEEYQPDAATVTVAVRRGMACARRLIVTLL